LMPLCQIESRTGFYGDDLVSKAKRNSARRTCERQIKFV
jgi:hypothetical protein